MQTLSIPERDRQIVGHSHEDGTVLFQKPEYHYCPLCGTLLELRDDHGAARPMCSRCGYVAYYNPAPAVGAVITSGDQVLLVRRKYPPKQGMWSLPAGFIEFGERQIDSLAREVVEETGLEISSGILLCVEDASDNPRIHALLIAFLVDQWRGDPVPGDDASEVGWFPIQEPPADMAWRNHVRVLSKAREWLPL